MGVFDQHEFVGTDRYEVRRRIGAGGMGVVYEAIDAEAARPVAIKTLGRIDANAIYRIKKEFRALADVSHPNLVGLHELVNHEEQWFFVMELVEGVDLGTWVRARDDASTAASAYQDTVLRTDPTRPTIDATWSQTRGALFSEELTDTQRSTAPEEDEAPEPPVYASVKRVDLWRLRESFLQLVDGLEALHTLGKLHRDIKPSNVLVTDAGRVVLLDFGLATELTERSLIQSSAQGLVCGTIAYMSPEQGVGEKLAASSDWYSVGVMLFEALTGRLPFEGPIYKVLMDKQRIDAPAPRDFVEDVPEALDAICRRLLARAPEARPGAAELRAALGGGEGPLYSPSASMSIQASSVFVGRRRELDALSAAFAHVEKKGTAVVFLEGRTGMGKSALAQEFVRGLLRADRAVVLRGRCHERELVPFKAVDGMIDALSRFLRTLPLADAEALLPRDIDVLARLFPVLARVEAIGNRVSSAVQAVAPSSSAEAPTSLLRDRGFAALRSLLVGIAARVPLVIALDDLHWGDADSGHLLAHLLAPPNPPPMLLLASYRPSDRPRLLEALDATLRDQASAIAFTHVEVGPLEPGAARALARSLLGDKPIDGAARAERAEQIADESGGNPLFVYELAGGDTPMQRLQLEDVLASRIASLPEPARQLLEVVASSPGPIATTVANTAADLLRGDRATSVLLVHHRLLRTAVHHDVEQLEVIHERVRDAVLQTLEPERVRQLHATLARLLNADEDADPVALVEHLEGSGDALGAADRACRAGRLAFEAMAFERAAALFERAIRLNPSADHGATKAWRAEALANAGRYVAAADAYLAAAEEVPVERALDLRRRAGEQLLTSGHVGRGVEILRGVLEEVGVRFPSTRERAMRSVTMARAALALRGLAFTPRPARALSATDRVRMDVCSALARGFALVDMIRAAYFATKFTKHALAAGDPHRIVRALAFEVVLVGTIDRSTDRIDETLVALERAAQLARSPHNEGLVLMSRGFVAHVRGRWRESTEALDAALAIFESRCVGVAWEISTSRLIGAESIAYLGRLGALRDRVESQIEAADRRGDLYTSTASKTFPQLTLSSLAADRPHELRDEVTSALAEWGDAERDYQHYAATASLVQADLYEGRAADAWARMAPAFEALEASLFLRVHLLSVSASDLFVRAALAAARESDAPRPILTAAKRRLRALRQVALPHVAAVVALARAQLSVLEGRTEEARTHYGEAIDGFEACGMSMALAAARWRLAELSPPKEAASLRAAASAVFEREGVVAPQRLLRVYAPIDSPG